MLGHLHRSWAPRSTAPHICALLRGKPPCRSFTFKDYSIDSIPSLSPSNSPPRAWLKWSKSGPGTKTMYGIPSLSNAVQQRLYKLGKYWHDPKGLLNLRVYPTVPPFQHLEEREVRTYAQSMHLYKILRENPNHFDGSHQITKPLPASSGLRRPMDLDLDLPPFRVVVQTSKKRISKHAVVRNRCRRRVKKACQELMIPHALRGYDYLWTCHTVDLESLPWPEVLEAVERGLRGLRKWSDGDLRPGDLERFRDGRWPEIIEQNIETWRS